MFGKYEFRVEGEVLYFREGIADEDIFIYVEIEGFGIFSRVWGEEGGLRLVSVENEAV